jgi:hypothetical protein
MTLGEKTILSAWGSSRMQRLPDIRRTSPATLRGPGRKFARLFEL